MDTGFLNAPGTQNRGRKALLGLLGALAIIGVVATIAVVSQPNPEVMKLYELDEAEFKVFTLKYGKKYDTEEEFAKRFTIYRQNVAYINQINSEGRSYRLAVNEFADLTNAEFREIYVGNNQPKREYSPVTLSTDDLAAAADWTKEGAVTPVKNQGQCGSCWSFSTTGSLEGLNYLKTGTLLSFSEQNLVDCDKVDQGCNGGLMDNAFKYVSANGIALEGSYPYDAQDGSCKVSGKDLYMKDIKYTDVPSKNEEQLKAAVAQQPVSVAVDAGGFGWQFYWGGVYTECSGQQLDHGVLAVGYDTGAASPYWKVKNSWGSSWGESGYIRMEYGKDCNGLANQASYPHY